MERPGDNRCQAHVTPWREEIIMPGGGDPSVTLPDAWEIDEKALKVENL